MFPPEWIGGEEDGEWMHDHPDPVVYGMDYMLEHAEMNEIPMEYNIGEDGAAHLGHHGTLDMEEMLEPEQQLEDLKAPEGEWEGLAPGEWEEDTAGEAWRRCPAP